MAQDKELRAAAIIIGDEILSGRTQDVNVKYVADKLGEVGVDLVEVRMILDDRQKIIDTVNELRSSYSYVFTTGGIGPTHDDITSESIADAFELELIEDPEARDVLEEYYGHENLTEARLKMAKVPEGATLIPNPISAAPGFQIGNVFVMAGIPQVMQMMMDYAVSHIEGGRVVHSRTLASPLGEGVIAAGLGAIQEDYEGNVSIGSYPRVQDKRFSVNIVMRSRDEALLDEVYERVEALLEGLAPGQLGVVEEQPEP